MLHARTATKNYGKSGGKKQEGSLGMVRMKFEVRLNGFELEDGMGEKLRTSPVSVTMNYPKGKQNQPFASSTA